MPASDAAATMSTSVLGKRVLSGMLAGIAEIVFFHPVDTAAKRLIVNQGTAAPSPWSSCSPSLRMRLVTAQEIVFQGLPADVSAAARIGALYPGVSFALLYKTLQRGYQYTMQPQLSNYFASRHRDMFQSCFGSKLCRPAEHAVAGAIMGGCEVVLIPVDSLKVKRQTNQPLGFAASRSDGHLTRLWGMFRGWQWMAARNTIGSFTLFGGAAAMKEFVLELPDFERATIGQHFLSSIAASICCVLISGPFDVLKTRVQRQGGAVNNVFFAQQGHGEACIDGVRVRSGLQIARELTATEGLTAFFKGSVPKCCAVAPKIMFTYSVSHWLYSLMCSSSR